MIIVITAEKHALNVRSVVNVWTRCAVRCCASCIDNRIVRKSTSESVTPFQPTNQTTLTSQSVRWGNRTLAVRIVHHRSIVFHCIAHADTWGIKRVHRTKFEYNAQDKKRRDKTRQDNTQTFQKLPRIGAIDGYQMPYAKYHNKIYCSIYTAIIVMSRFIIMFLYTCTHFAQHEYIDSRLMFLLLFHFPHLFVWCVCVKCKHNRPKERSHEWNATGVRFGRFWFDIALNN